MDIPDGEPVPVYVKELRFPVMLYKQVFKNKDRSAGVRYLVTNDETMSGDRFKTLYKKRWSVEVYHESIKQNTSIGGSPAHTERTQSNHVFCGDIRVCKIGVSKTQSRLQSLCGKITDLHGIIEAGDGITVCF
jgi:hypothetical protein